MQRVCECRCVCRCTSP